MTGRATTRPGSAEQAAWQVASTLLDYPDQSLLDRAPVLRRVAARLPAPLAAPLGSFLDHIDNSPLLELQTQFVATFDHTKRCCLYLTYYAHGDTRKRGIALLQFKSAYLRAGLVVAPDELPDHLGVVLEFAATADPAAGQKLLVDHRAGLELLRLALEDAGSPYVDVLRAVSATLPPLRGADREAVARLAAQGPPAEEVGLQPFAPPEYMPQAEGARR